MSDEAELEVSALGVDTIGSSPFVGFNTFQLTVLNTLIWVRAVLGVPSIAAETVGVSSFVVIPSPVGIHGDWFRFHGATELVGTGGKVDLWALFLLEVSDLLCVNGSEESGKCEC